jgi:hypothetical protein
MWTNPYMPGGSKFMRNPPPPLRAIFPDGIPSEPYPPALCGAPGTEANLTVNRFIDRQDTMFKTILQRLPPLMPLPGVPMAAGALAQMTVPTAVVEAAPLIMGGPLPVCYVYVGANQGLSIWGRTEIVAASIMEDGEVGNGGGV